MHLQQLRKAKVISFVEDETRVFAKRGLDNVYHALDKAEHFLFTAIPEDNEEIDASVEAMKEVGVWRLPYPVTTFEFTATLVPVGMKSRGGDELQKIERGSRHTMIVVAMEECENGEGELTKMASAGFVRWIFSRHPTNKAEWLSMGSELAHDEVQRIFNALMVILHTRGIKRERWSGDHKLLKHRPEPANAYTRVLIRETAEAGHGATILGDRCRVRLHLRRGHKRDQSYGKGRALTRTIWIEPCLVGYADEGVVEHEEYEV
jgi:hypothetical protein